LLLTVDGPAGRGEDHPPDSVLHAVLQEADRPDYVDLSVEVRLAHRAPDVHLGGLVAEDFGVELLEHLRTPGADVAFVEGGCLGDVHSFPGGQIVYYGHCVASLEQVIGHVRADEPGSAG
jgi:hypothetical protein